MVQQNSYEEWIFFFVGYAYELSHSVVVSGGERIFCLLFFLSCPSKPFGGFQGEVLMNLQFLQFFTNRGKGNKKEFCYFVSTPFLLCHLFHCWPLLFFTTLLSRKEQQEKNVTDGTLFTETKGKEYLFQGTREECCVESLIGIYIRDQDHSVQLICFT